jgi:hypothetical protein
VKPFIYYSGETDEIFCVISYNDSTFCTIDEFGAIMEFPREVISNLAGPYRLINPSNGGYSDCLHTFCNLALDNINRNTTNNSRLLAILMEKQ